MNLANINSKISIFTLVVLGAVPPAVLLAAPLLTGVFVNSLGFTPQQSGYIISAYLGGTGIASLPALWWVSRFSWQKVGLVTLIVMMIGYFISMQMSSFESMFWVQLVTGLAAGTAMSVCMASIGLTQNPDRVFSLWVIGQLVLGALCLKLVPVFADAGHGMKFYLFLAALTIILILLHKNIPDHKSETQAKDDAVSDDSSFNLTHACFCIFGLLCFYIAVSGAWTNMAGIGLSGGVSESVVTNTLSISLLIGIAGSSLSAALGGRFGRLFPSLAALAGFVIALFVFKSGFNTMAFVLLSCVFIFSWMFVLPFLMAAIASIDVGGRLVIMTNLVIGVGMSAGPALAATMLQGNDYSSVILLSLGTIVLCFLLFIPVLLKRSS